MRVLHTSDWHLGGTLYHCDRTAEFSAFLTWLLEKIRILEVDVLLISGDIFDVSMPPLSAQEQFYHFLAQVKDTGCKHVVAIAGNHDSGRLIDLPRPLLDAFDVHVVGCRRVDFREEVIDTGEMVVCAVPYLREGDVRVSGAGESIETREQNLRIGIAEHYREVARIAEDLRGSRDIPIVAMGHLFAAGGVSGGDDHVRPIVGNLQGVDATTFPETFDYVALGHLHTPQRVAKTEHIWYSGAPLAMGFDEVGTKKVCLLVDFDGRKPKIQELDIPIFQKMCTISGNDEFEITDQLHELITLQESVYVRIQYYGAEPSSSFQNKIRDYLKNSLVECLCIENKRALQNYISGQKESNVDMRALDPEDVFVRLLNMRGIPESERAPLMAAYHEVLNEVLQS